MVGVTNTYGMPVVAIVGDGQLARMMQTEAIELGFGTRLLAGSNEASAAQVIADARLGDYTSLKDLQEATAGTDVVTFDHEHVPNEHLQVLIDADVNPEPRPAALIYAQDKLEQRTRLRDLGAPVPEFAGIASADDAKAFWDFVDGAVCLKATRGGYDGKGVWFPDTLDECLELVEELLGRGVPLMGERKVPFERELSAMVARRRSGEVAAWQVAESIQDGGVCRVTIAPAPGISPELAKRAEDLACRIATELDVTGVLAVELFEAGGEILVNELAMRPHNTHRAGNGHGEHPWWGCGSGDAHGPACGRRDGEVPAGQDPPLRQAVAPGPQDGPRQRCCRYGGSRTRGGGRRRELHHQRDMAG